MCREPEGCIHSTFRGNSDLGRIPVSDLQIPPFAPTAPDGSIPPEIQPPVPPPVQVLGENPAWGWLELIGILAVGLVALVFGVVIVLVAAHRYLYPRDPVMEAVQQHPILLIAAQVLAYLGVVGFMALVVKRDSQSFGQGIRWNWPDKPWGYLLGGVALSFGLQFLGHFLPVPKDLPIDRFFRTPVEAWGLALFGIFCAPLVEELFFRGFLYPVLARWFGVVASIVITALGFGLVHAGQLGRAWGPVLVIFLVGIALTAVRAKTKSVAAGWLMHFAYNSTIFGLMFLATSGFRHLERLTQ